MLTWFIKTLNCLNVKYVQKYLAVIVRFLRVSFSLQICIIKSFKNCYLIYHVFNSRNMSQKSMLTWFIKRSNFSNVKYVQKYLAIIFRFLTVPFPLKIC